MTVARAGVNSAYSKNDVDQSINDVGRYVQCSNTKKKKEIWKIFFGMYFGKFIHIILQ